MVINMKYEVNGKQYEVWSSKNQSIISKFVDREVYANVTDMVEFILQNSYGYSCGEAPFTNDDIENMYVDNSDEIEELNEELEELQNKHEELDDRGMELDDEIENLESELEDIDNEEERLEFENKIDSHSQGLTIYQQYTSLGSSCSDSKSLILSSSSSISDDNTS